MDTFATALYVKIDDELATNPSLRIWRPEVGIAPKLSDAELLTMAVLQALLGFTSETRFLRYARKHLGGYFPYLPHQSGYNKRLRRAQAQLNALIRVLGQDTDLWDDDTWVIDSTPVECGRSRPTARRSDLAGFAGYGYCATPATSGDCDCTWSVRQLAFRLPSHWPIPRSTSGRWPGTSSRSTPICSAIGRARSSWPTRATPAPSSRASLPARAHDSSDRPRKARLLDPVRGS